MYNPNATSVLVDAADRIILLSDIPLEVALFVQRNVLDVRFFTILNSIWKVEHAPPLAEGGFYSFRKHTFAAVSENDVSDIVRQKMRRCKLLADGYAYMLWFANVATEAYWSVASIDFSDLPLLQTDRQTFVELFAESKGMPRTQAQKQIAFDEENLRTLALRRKQIIWVYEELLLRVDTDEQLAQWKLRIYNDTINIGAV